MCLRCVRREKERGGGGDRDVTLVALTEFTSTFSCSNIAVFVQMVTILARAQIHIRRSSDQMGTMTGALLTLKMSYADATSFHVAKKIRTFRIRFSSPK